MCSWFALPKRGRVSGLEVCPVVRHQYDYVMASEDSTVKISLNGFLRSCSPYWGVFLKWDYISQLALSNLWFPRSAWGGSWGKGRAGLPCWKCCRDNNYKRHKLGTTNTTLSHYFSLCDCNLNRAEGISLPAAFTMLIIPSVMTVKKARWFQKRV